MQLGIFAKTFEGVSPGPVLWQVKDAGFATAQYNMACSGLPPMPNEVPDAAVNAIREAVQESGVPLCALSATWNMIHPDLAKRAVGHRNLRVLAGVARDLGIPLLTLCTGTRDAHDQWRHHPENASPEAWRDLLASMEKALEVVEDHDLALGIEPEMSNVVSGAAQAKQLLDELKSPRLRIVLDPANLFERTTIEEQRRIISSAVETLGDRISIVHAKDRAADGAFVPAGQGVLDYRHFIRELMKLEFNGPLVTHGLTAAEAPGVARFLAHQLESAVCK